jgi:hypothetical protein
MKGAFATRMSGSADLYHNHDRRPYHSINFVTAHDGFSLHDLVSYNFKHNQVRLAPLFFTSTLCLTLLLLLYQQHHAQRLLSGQHTTLQCSVRTARAVLTDSS